MEGNCVSSSYIHTTDIPRKKAFFLPFFALDAKKSLLLPYREAAGREQERKAERVTR